MCMPPTSSPIGADLNAERRDFVDDRSSPRRVPDRRGPARRDMVDRGGFGPENRLKSQ
jgi:hypothetical protein